MTNQSMRCPRCSGRLFLESDNWGRRPFHYWSCLSCSRKFDLNGRPVSYREGEKRVVEVPNLVRVSVR